MARFMAAEDVDVTSLDVLDALLDRRDFEYLREFGIRLMFRNNTLKSGGREVWGKAKLASAFERFLNPATAAYVILSEPIWQQLNAHQREALLDHKLRHFALTEDDELITVGHDLDEFAANWNAYGNWRPSLAEAAKQLELPFAEVDVIGGVSSAINRLMDDGALS